VCVEVAVLGKDNSSRVLCDARRVFHALTVRTAMQRQQGDGDRACDKVIGELCVGESEYEQVYSVCVQCTCAVRVRGEDEVYTLL
jgi:hypothetical protein